MPSTTCFASPAPTIGNASYFGKAVCTSSHRYHDARKSYKSTLRMEIAETIEQQQVESTQSTPQTPKTWPPAEMTEEWAEAVLRLSNSVNGASLENADEALDAADGDEMLALKYLMEDNRSEIQKKRERAVEAARAAGDVNRVSAIKEAEMRRTATGSARDFFKGFVEVEGQYVDAGYVDESADAMGQLMGKVKGWFGKKE